ncbi:hypothetical protein A1O3_05711 [Capronia epimyces CBS 606.96]|uniref:Nuclease S1 n=1 Tax=Capronia epimyces CBS 606.96 TaxID=1182542 RepID=W9Y721_9EURO|nr:uncharacterized protein A1O3_05711 [Capronia epimyces CBS 606.96]EXJ85036.1 hypothetical protein A1O3_05711 [Capronia epimyces CBS 606.96]
MHSTVPFRAVILLLLTARLTFAWGTLGHETVAWIAQSYVSETTESTVKSILGSTRSDYMANVSTWADSYRYTSSGRWSAPLHYIDANDSPPSSCSVDYSRDCGEAGCSVSAIVNYTSILLDNTSGQALKNDAMKFIIHFIGDIHQPLHDEALDVGGNTINVTYDGEATNLHHIWDTEIVEQLANGAGAQEFAKNLSSAIRAGDYGWDVDSWLNGVSLNDTLSTGTGWASEANAYVCSDVLHAGVDAVEEGGDLSGTYYQAHYDVARVQIARAGYRLGAWLNLIITGRTDG